MSNELDKVKSEVERRLQKQQEGKEFKDVGRVAMTRKEKSAYKIISEQMLSDLELDRVMAYNMVKKDMVWTAIDVEAEKQRGTTAGAAFLKVKIREAVPTRPDDRPDRRQSYVLFLTKLQNDLAECSTIDQIKELTNLIAKWNIDDAMTFIVDSKWANLTSEERDAKKAEFQKNTKFIGFRYIYSLTEKLIKEVFSAKFVNILFADSDSARETWATARSYDAVSQEQATELIDYYKERITVISKKINETIAEYQTADNQKLMGMVSNFTFDSKLAREMRNNLEHFRKWAINFYERKNNQQIASFEKKISETKVKDNDWSWLEKKKEVKSEVKSGPEFDKLTINTKSPLSYIKRIGGYKITQITPQQIIDQFGFSAVNYGVYVDDKWSKDHTNHFLGAISDLGDILDLNIKKLNQIGKLGIAFGAKGRKGHAAAYFPMTKDINLTRSNGDGSVAHEWGHYLDNVICELDERTASNRFASRGQCMDPTISLKFKNLFDFIHKGDPEITPLVPTKFFAVKSERIPEFYSRSKGNVKVQILSTIEQTIDQYPELLIRDAKSMSYNTQTRVFGYIIDQFGLDSYMIPMKLKTSYFFQSTAYDYFAYCYKTIRNDREIIQPVASARSNYWISEVEMFARAFETVVLKKLVDQGRVSNYLVDSIPLEPVVSEHYAYPYPNGKELDHIEKLIDEILEAIKYRFIAGGFIAPSTIKEDEYAELSAKKDGTTKQGVKVDTETPDQKKVEFIENDEVKKVETVDIPLDPESQNDTSNEDEDVNIPELIAGLEVLILTIDDQKEKQEVIDLIEGLKLLA